MKCGNNLQKLEKHRPRTSPNVNHRPPTTCIITSWNRSLHKIVYTGFAVIANKWRQNYANRKKTWQRPSISQILTSDFLVFLQSGSKCHNFTIHFCGDKHLKYTVTP